MNSDHALELMNQLLWNSMLIAGPLLLVALFVGLAVSVLQVACQTEPLAPLHDPARRARVARRADRIAAIFVEQASEGLIAALEQAVRD